MIDAATLASLRAAVATALPDTAQVQRPSRVFDEAGGWAQTYTTASTVACRVGKTGFTTGSERVYADRLGARAPFTVYLPHDADVHEADRLVVASADPGVGPQTYEVLGVMAPLSWMVHVRCVCAREG